ncbi:MAG: Tad domain-containing protein [Bryobacteraceae bacterium]
MQRREEGQAVLLVLVALSFVSIGAIGLAIDGSQIYAHRQMAQNAADAAVQAGVMSIFNGTNVGSNAFGSTAFSCTPTDARTPCVYARMNGFGQTADDTVAIDFPASAPGVNLSALDPVNLIRATVTRTLQTGLMRFLGPATSTVRASATAAISGVVSPVPILVTHPTLDGAFSIGGSGSIAICGGPRRSIQVNSNSASSISAGGSSVVDLSKAGPDDPGDCSTGTGGDFGDFGGPSAYPGTLQSGTKGKYIQPSSPILDPLASVPVPAVPPAAPAKTALANGANGCPASPSKSCNLYSPGLYTGGIDVKNETAVFKPGVYYIDGGGFGNSANGLMVMATGFAADPDTGQGMLVYNTGSGVFDIGSNSSANLTGTPDVSIYKGILFFQDRNAPSKTHSLGGGGDLTLIGTLYLTNTNMTASYQKLLLRGNSGNTTKVIGMVLASALDIGGTGSIQLQLNPDPILTVRQVALVN